MGYLDIIADAEKTPYKLGTHDCFLVARSVVSSVTGKDYPIKSYRTRAQSLKRIAAIAPTFRGAIGIFFGLKEIPVLMAQRGDLVLFDDGNSEHIGICLGEQVAVLGENGLIRINITSSQLIIAWRVTCPSQ